MRLRRKVERDFPSALGFDPKPKKLSRNRAPVAVPDSNVQPSKEFRITVSDVAQIPLLKEQGERSGPQRNEFGR